ncbi:hypothetical protein BOTBODRAFT_49771 [Botryobasidium botryosum FD-172 SS1]|uniref:Ubiquitin-like protease family profile domain-containing protein n=1 Tax=Botryobasidium botryosum (strain FD-172 SS1) TaxID=930990 RepID=A0A067LTS4_BOTB1|nr:hypothetical protein BOTBODRAFT_49771 [Botryobasidium botryosum FD-172 SS1]
MIRISSGGNEFSLPARYESGYCQLMQKLVALNHSMSLDWEGLIRGTLSLAAASSLAFVQGCLNKQLCYLHSIEKRIVRDAQHLFGGGVESHRLPILDSWLLLEIHGHHNPGKVNHDALYKTKDPLEYDAFKQTWRRSRTDFALSMVVVALNIIEGKWQLEESGPLLLSSLLASKPIDNTPTSGMPLKGVTVVQSFDSFLLRSAESFQQRLPNHPLAVELLNRATYRPTQKTSLGVQFMDKALNRAMSNMGTREMGMLANPVWVNDNVIMFGLNEMDSLMKWYKKPEEMVFFQQYILIPIHVGGDHWYLGIIYRPEYCVRNPDGSPIKTQTAPLSGTKSRKTYILTFDSNCQQHSTAHQWIKKYLIHKAAHSQFRFHEDGYGGAKDIEASNSL